jgi:hypothetical protein
VNPQRGTRRIVLRLVGVAIGVVASVLVVGPLVSPDRDSSSTQAEVTSGTCHSTRYAVTLAYLTETIVSGSLVIEADPGDDWLVDWWAQVGNPQRIEAPEGDTRLSSSSAIGGDLGPTRSVWIKPVHGGAWCQIDARMP